MNTNPNAKVVLCYGDSNTHGKKPDRTGRYPANIRWTGLLQQRLGDDFYVIEEGLGGRTVDKDHPESIGKNGKTYLRPCIESHKPHIVVIMLGTNDFKRCFDTNAVDIAGALSGLVDDVRALYENESSPSIIVVCPASINSKAPNFMNYYDKDYDVSAGGESDRLATVLDEVCRETDVEFFDANTVVGVGDDGLHWPAEANAKFAEAIEKLVRQVG